MGPFTPLTDIVPSPVVEYLSRNPENSMSYLTGTDIRNGEQAVNFFIKCNYVDVQYLVDAPAVKALFRFYDEQNDRGDIMVLRAEFLQADARKVAELTHVATGRTLEMYDCERPPEFFVAETEFGRASREQVGALASVLQQTRWQFAFVTNDCRYFLHAKEFANPLSPDTKARVLAWMKAAG